MAVIDWVIVGLYVIGAVAVGAYFAKRAAKSTDDFFVAGRSLPWFIAGTSIVATTFSSDTPLFVAGMTRDSGISSNWFWWSGMMGTVASIFFFARLWRRTGAQTDMEFVAQRYDASPATSGLRVFGVVYWGLIVNVTVMASVTLAMAKVLKVILNLSDEPVFTITVFGNVTNVTHTAILLIILGGAAALYSILSGLYGVVYTDIVQFVLAMVGSIALAAIAYADASSGEGLMAKLQAAPGFKESMLDFIPELTNNLPTISFLCLMFFLWWGAAPGSGYAVQRLLACRTERDSFLAFLWYAFCHYVLRSWPWLMVGMLSLIYLPGLADSESAFPEMINKFMPIGLKGIMVASLLAAFMSTLDTHLNWGASYLVNDLYRPFIAAGKSKEHYVKVSRIGMAVLVLLALVVSSKLSGILAAYKYLGVIMAGVGTVMIARWYWWRVNAWSEISAMATALVVGNLLGLWLLTDVKADGVMVEDWFAVRAAMNMAISFVVWLTVTLITSREPSAKAKAFYRRMRIGGPGWRRVAEAMAIAPLGSRLGVRFAAWIACTLMLSGLLLAIGKFLFLSPLAGAAWLAVAIASGLVLRALMSRADILGGETADVDAQEPAVAAARETT